MFYLSIMSDNNFRLESTKAKRNERQRKKWREAERRRINRIINVMDFRARSLTCAHRNRNVFCVLLFSSISTYSSDLNLMIFYCSMHSKADKQYFNVYALLLLSASSFFSLFASTRTEMTIIRQWKRFAILCRDEKRAAHVPLPF